MLVFLFRCRKHLSKPNRSTFLTLNFFLFLQSQNVNIRLVVMNNILKSTFRCHQLYDLKVSVTNVLQSSCHQNLMTSSVIWTPCFQQPNGRFLLSFSFISFFEIPQHTKFKLHAYKSQDTTFNTDNGRTKSNEHKKTKFCMLGNFFKGGDLSIVELIFLLATLMKWTMLQLKVQHSPVFLFLFQSCVALRDNFFEGCI